ncbi:MAG: hypothetical protein LLF89_09810 [Spirochaetaceae bacterium]|nr:hypothetical protein [Spirochaetaceae bacterium]
MKRIRWVLALLAVLVLLGSCVSTKMVVVSVDKIPPGKAKQDLTQPLLECLRDFGNNMARIMLSDYKFINIHESGDGAYLYRFDTKNKDLPKHAYIVFRLEGTPTISTNVGSKNYIQIDNGSVGLVPSDEPAAINGKKFKLKFTSGNFKEAFNPYVIGEKGDYPPSIMLWFKDPATKDAKMQQMASLLLSAFPELKYKTK